MNQAELKEKFIKIYEENIKREGADKLLEWIKKVDFFTAPASTRYHGAYEGGLVEHSLNVYEWLNKLCELLPEAERPTNEIIAVSALLHDVCKIQFYKKDFRNVKDESGKWTVKETYAIEEKFPCGHGEKSVILLQSFMRLSVPEILAIRFHMGGFDESVKGGSYAISGALDSYKLVSLLHAADLLATYITESKGEMNG